MGKLRVSARSGLGRLRRLWESDIAWSYRGSPLTIVASVVAATIVIAAVCAPWVAPYNPFDAATLDLMEGFSPPGEASYGAARAARHPPVQTRIRPNGRWS